jgi:hypothetical protein
MGAKWLRIIGIIFFVTLLLYLGFLTLAASAAFFIPFAVCWVVTVKLMYAHENRWDINCGC